MQQASEQQQPKQPPPPGSPEKQQLCEYVGKIYELTDFYNKAIIFCAITLIVPAA